MCNPALYTYDQDLCHYEIAYSDAWLTTVNSGPGLCDDCINYNTFCVYLFNRTCQMDVSRLQYASSFYWRHSRPNEELRRFNWKLMFFKSVLNVSSVWFLSVIQLQDKLRLILKKLCARLDCVSFYCFSSRKSRLIFCKMTYIFLYRLLWPIHLDGYSFVIFRMLNNGCPWNWCSSSFEQF